MPSLSMDNEELYFCRAPVDYVSRSVQSEKIQIFISKKSDSIWLTPEKIGPPVNMMTYDSAPRIMPDGKTLLFCSARPGGMGGYDIWKVERDNRFSAWTRASNLGAVNTTNNEAYFAFTIDASRMFLSARWSMDRKYDIYAYSMEAKFAAPTVTLQGRVTNLRTGKIVAADILLESFSNKKYSVKIQNDQFSGKYSITLPAGDRYSLTVQATGFMFDSRELDLRELKKSSVTNVSFGLKPLEKGEKIVVDTVYFDPDSWVLRQESELALYKMAQILKDNPAVCLLINGHVAKAVGARGKPQLVSEMRAREVMKFLVDHGIDQSRLKARGFGDTQPIGDNATEEGRIRNRRTEFEIIRSE
jgi:outer membrane protein OmpA-like peptidoglycan-associated protein